MFQKLLKTFRKSEKEEKTILQDTRYQSALALEREIIEKNTAFIFGETILCYDTQFTILEKDTFIHTLECGQRNSIPLLLIHGYGGSGVTFCGILEILSQYYHVFTIDILGMGLSDRKNFGIDGSSTESIIDFFVESVHKWRIELGLIQPIILVGHSFGGYISACYFKKYPDLISELFLLSPMAGTRVSEYEDVKSDEKFEEYASGQPFLKKMILKILRKQHHAKITVHALTRKWFLPSRFFIGKALKNKLKNHNPQQIRIWRDYFTNLYALPECSDHLIHELISLPFVQAKKSIEEIFEKLDETAKNIKVHFVFGDADWMDSRGCFRLSCQIAGSFRYVENASHQLIFDQPQKIAEIIIDPSVEHPSEMAVD